jgi:hypothetical protein
LQPKNHAGIAAPPTVVFKCFCSTATSISSNIVTFHPAPAFSSSQSVFGQIIAEKAFTMRAVDFTPNLENEHLELVDAAVYPTPPAGLGTYKPGTTGKSIIQAYAKSRLEISN